jgi:hypothetical protein
MSKKFCGLTPKPCQLSRDSYFYYSGVGTGKTLLVCWLPDALRLHKIVFALVYKPVLPLPDFLPHLLKESKRISSQSSQLSDCASPTARTAVSSRRARAKRSLFRGEDNSILERELESRDLAVQTIANRVSGSSKSSIRWNCDNASSWSP